MLIDAFPFFNERDILLLRLKILYPFVDKFVLIEGNTTHSGDPNLPMYARDLRHEPEFAPFKDKIIYQTAELNLIESDWGREGHQRDMILDACSSFAPTDHVMVSDVDEIPRPETAFVQGIYQQRMFYYYLNVEADYQWYGTTCMPLAFWRANGINNIRKATHRGDYSGLSVVTNGGWHFSTQAGERMVHKKLRSYAHQEYNNPDTHRALRQRMDLLQDPFGRGEQFHLVTVDSSYPTELTQNLEQYRHLLYHN